MRDAVWRRLQAMIGAVALALVVVAGLPAAADLRIDITRGVVEPLPIVILPFPSAGGDQASDVGTEITNVIAADLERSGLFKPLDPRPLSVSQPSLDTLPMFANWRLVNTQALVHGRTTALPDGRLKIEFRLWDVFAEQEMLGRAYSTPAGNWRRIAHVIADAIYKRITGEDGYFDTRIAYIAESGPRSRRTKRLAIMDQDGANHQFLTEGNNLVLTPRFSPSSQDIAYLRYADSQPRVHIRNLTTRADEALAGIAEITFAPRYAPDGERLIVSMAVDGNTDIYTYDLSDRTRRRLTTTSGIDTSASYSPDGRQIAFNSDRGGSLQLYVMDADGSSVRRISRGDGRYATPVWSPRGDLIAFTKTQGGQFHIGVMRPDGSGERLLAQGFRVEGPAWAPNGRVILFFRQEPALNDAQGGRSRLFTVDLTGQNERELVTPLDASDPAWSPLRP
ncbi:Protein TolB [uncultured Defluviicoccus sp.]|uniref:Protein TolB n=1 Tax=metagenome TaxID=256318 RepID=A0A380TGD5_9ZZZZ|nr:Protein TolB [uncultured Defluviicoccus sp.]